MIGSVSSGQNLNVKPVKVSNLNHDKCMTKIKHLSLKKANIRRTCRIMRVFFLFFTLGIGVCFSNNSYSQSTKISLNLKNKTVKQVFSEIEKNSEFIFFYQDDILDVNRKVTVNTDNGTIEQILNEVLSATGNTYFVSDRSIYIIKKASDTANEEIVQQQKRTITGRITDKDGESIIGANILEKGTRNGTITDVDGKFSLSVENDAVLRISYIGYLSQDINTAGKTIFNIILQEEVRALEEMVVVGYGTVKKKDLTGSISKIDAKSFQEQSVYSIENALAGRIAGVKVTDAAAPGSGGSVQIRGSNSMLGGTEPLYVVDGIPIDRVSEAKGQTMGGATYSSINFIDPASIEKIEVLKDASATAIYGARGANGVVIITTKGGKARTQQLEFKYSLSTATVAQEREVLSGPEFANWVNMGINNTYYLRRTWWDYQQQLFENGEISTMPSVSPWGGTIQSDFDLIWRFNGLSPDFPLPDSPDLVNTNWQDEVFRTAITHNYHIGYSGGTDKGTYSFSVGYLDQEGVVTGSAFKKLTANTSVTQNITDKLSVNSRAILSRSKANALMTNNGYQEQNLINKILTFAPVNKPLEEGGTYEDFLFNNTNFMDSPIDIAKKLKDDKEQMYLLGSFSIGYQVLKSLRFNATGAVTFYMNKRDTYWPSSTFQGAMDNGQATNGGNRSIKETMQYQLTYNKQFDKNNRIDAVAVHSYEKNASRSEWMLVKNFPTDILGYKSLNSGTVYSVPQTYFQSTVLKSYLGRVNYNFYDRYLFTVSLRADGSSRFAKNNKWGFFPSGAFAWRMGEEAFIKGLGLFSNLKLRLSYGRTGGQAISPYQSLAAMAIKNYTFNDGSASGFVESRLENPDLKWETTLQYNTGLDFGFFNNRFNLTFDAYYKKTQDLLMNVQNPPSSGFNTKLNNIGAVRNKGIEVEVQANVLNGPLKWDVNANIAFNRNKVLEMGVSGFQYSSFSVTSASPGTPIIFKEGYPLGVLMGYESVRIFETWDEVYKSHQKDGTSVGDMMYKDQNNDGVLNDDDLVVIGDPNPDANWGITNEFKYKNFDLSFLIDGQIGGEVFSVDNLYLNSNYRWSNTTRKNAKNSWTPEGGLPGWETSSFTVPEGYDYGFGNSDPYTATTMYHPYSSQRWKVTDEYITSTSFIKLRNIALGYNFSPRQLRSLRGIQQVRLYLSATNLLLITNYEGFDPEVTAFNADPSRRGIDLGTYPTARTFTFGINATF